MILPEANANGCAVGYAENQLAQGSSLILSSDFEGEDGQRPTEAQVNDCNANAISACEEDLNKKMDEFAVSCQIFCAQAAPEGCGYYVNGVGGTLCGPYDSQYVEQGYSCIARGGQVSLCHCTD